METKYKIFVSFIFILFSSVLVAQRTRIRISNYDYDAKFDDGKCDDEIKFTAYFVGGGSSIFESYRNKKEGKRAPKNYIVNGVVKYIEVYMYAKDKYNPLFGGRYCASGSRGGRVRGTYRINTPINPCDNGSFYKRHSDSNDYIGGTEVRQTLSFDYETTPLPGIIRESDYAGYDDILTLKAGKGFKKSVYNWQYSFLQGAPTDEWIDLPGPSKATREILVSEYFDESVIGKEVFFRTYACDYNGKKIAKGYKIRKSAPHIIDISTKPVSCYDATDGQVTLTFDKPLIESDQLSFTISDKSLPEGNVVTNLNNITEFEDANQIIISNLPPSSKEFLIEMIGSNTDGILYTEGINHSASFKIERPVPVSFVGEPADNVTNVYCYDGQDGEINLTAEGGIGDYEYLMRKEGETWSENTWIPFTSSTSHEITNLFPNTYYIKIRDGNECVAKEQTIIDDEVALGEEIIKEVIITQPEAPLSISTEVLNTPTAFGFNDGRILAVINGGTPIGENTYEFEWRDENDILINTTSATYSDGQGYLVNLHSIGEGQYTITAKDANYNDATNKEGCTMVSESITITQPLPLEVSIEIYPISCNAGNEYSDNVDTNFDGVPDQFQDGIMVASVTGGTRFNIENPDYGTEYPTNSNGDLLPYFYHWKMQLSDGSWQELSINDNRIDFLDTATNYSLNVTDKNGIVLGNYISKIEADGSLSYDLQEAVDVLEYLPKQEKLELTFVKKDATCANGNDAMAEVLVTGGVKPYTYEWSNGDNSAKINNQIAGIYRVFVTDAKGCRIEGSVIINQSNNIEIVALSVVPPTCFEGNDGQINVNVTGGVPPYTYKWNTGASSTLLQGLSAGTYTIEITDNSGCKAFFEETLINPDPVAVNLEEKRALCEGQSLTLDIGIDDSNATYEWFSDTGFTSSSSTVTLTKTGRYTAIITTELGCQGVGEITVETFDTPIASDFLIVTQAYVNEEIVLINVSNPRGEIVEWTIPEQSRIISKNEEELVLKFENEGTYEINLRSFQGDCYLDFTKTIIVEPAIESPEIIASQGNFIQEFIIYPNPNSGFFKTKISLRDESSITLKIISLLSGMTINERTEKSSQDFLLDYSISLPTGMYLMLLETSKGSETRKLIFE